MHSRFLKKGAAIETICFKIKYMHLCHMIIFSNPKQRYYIKGIIPFVIIWLVLGWHTLLIESMTTEYQNQRPDTDITITWCIFQFASIAIFPMDITISDMKLEGRKKKKKNGSPIRFQKKKPPFSKGRFFVGLQGLEP